MKEHIDDLIDAYMDGELTSQLERRVEAHTATCETCRSALTTRQQLSTLIREVPGIDGLRHGADFAAQLMVSMDKDYTQDIPWWYELRGVYEEIRIWLTDRRVQQVGWAVVPVVLLLASVFVRSVGLLNAVLSLIPESGSYLGQIFDVMNSIGTAQVNPSWGGTLGSMIAFDIGDWGIFTSLFASLLIGFLYAAWIVGWLFRRQEINPSEVEN